MIDKNTGKQIVRYRSIANAWPPIVGYGYGLYPVDHPSMYVSNTSICYTSIVVAIDFDTGRIETQNTVYIPENGEVIKQLRMERDSYEQLKQQIKSKHS